jgi:hypothetical protein
MTVARLDRELGSPELTRWKVYYQMLDDAKAGRVRDRRDDDT